LAETVEQLSGTSVQIRLDGLASYPESAGFVMLLQAEIRTEVGILFNSLSAIRLCG
jgi:hypothetical protein